MEKISKYLTIKDVERSSVATRFGLDNTLPSALYDNARYVGELYDKVYEHFKGNIIASSFYRGEVVNTKVGGSKTSQHQKAEAIDIEGINGVSNKEIFDFCRTLDFDQLIDEFHLDWVHISRSKKGNRKQVLKAIKDSKNRTVYQNI